MRELIKKVLTATCIFAVAFSMVFGMPTESFAASKSKKTAMSADEKALADLVAYRDALISLGASAADIDYANKAIEVQTKKIADAQAAALAALQAQELLKQQAAIAKQQAEALAKARANMPTAGIIFVGDSRIVQMHETVGDTGVTFIGENSKGYDWFKENAIPRVDNLVGKGTKIVINLGVNDPQNIDKYIKEVNAQAAKWEAMGAKVYYATVNPVWENPYTTKEQVENFNQRLVNGLVGVDIIDSYTWLTTNGYKLKDGLHFDDATNRNIYNLFLGSVL